MNRWHLRDLLVDSFRNARSARARSSIVALVAAGVVGALVFAELSTTGELLEFQAGFVGSGGNVFVASSEAGLPTDRCTALSALASVVDSAGVQPGPTAETTAAPGTLFNTGAVTVGALDLFTVEGSAIAADAAEGWIVGAAAATELGIRKGMWLSVDGGDARPVGAVIDTETRNPKVDRWIMSVQPPAGSVTECWVEFAPGVTTGRREAISAVFSDVTDTIVVPWIRLDEFSRDPVAELAKRPQASAWLIAGALIGLVGWLITWFRRSEIGLYRAVGTGPSALLILGTIELAIPVVIGALIGTLWAIATWTATTAGHPEADQLAIALRTGASTVLLALVTGPLLWPATSRESIANHLKDR